MDHELTGNAFRQFVGRRGLLRSSVEEPSRTSSSRSRHVGGATSQRHHSVHHQSTFHQNGVSGSGSGSGGGGSSNNHDSGSGTTTRRQYYCEICNLPFGRKHHKERHVANIHRQVRRVESRLVCE